MHTMRSLPYQPQGKTFWKSSRLQTTSGDIPRILPSSLKPEYTVAVCSSEEESPLKTITGFCRWSDILSGKVALTLVGNVAKILVSLGEVDRVCHVFEVQVEEYGRIRFHREEAAEPELPSVFIV